jgi:dTDP-glucose 4,6-dehydratase
LNLLVTGGAGFIGCNLLRHIIDESIVARVVNLDCLTYAGHLANVATLESRCNYCFERVDLRDRSSVRNVFLRHGITHVLHLAAESHVDRSIRKPADFITTNVLGTFNLLEACREFWALPDADCKNRFHHVSTDEVYGSVGPTGYFTEDSPYAPSSPYSASKASADMLVSAYYRTYGLNTVITNCSNNYGPYQFPEKLIPVVIRRIIHRQPVPVYGDGLHVRDWLFVGDHVAALWQVLLRGQPGETYNISAHNERANIRVVERICDLIDELRPELGGGSRQLITFVQDRPGHDRRYGLDSTKIREELGWKPAHSFEECIRETVRWYLENENWVETVLRDDKDWKSVDHLAV